MANDIKQLNEAYSNIVAKDEKLDALQHESSGAECYFYEKERGKWYYDIQNYPYGENGDYTTHGPFPDFRAAERHLTSHYQNPGGYGVKALPCDKHEPYSPRGHTQKFCAKCGKFLGEAEDFPEPPKYGDKFWYPDMGEITYLKMNDAQSSDATFMNRHGERITLSIDDKQLKRAPNEW